MVEDLLDLRLDNHHPVLIVAKGACLPEDFGGPSGLRRPESDPR